MSHATASEVVERIQELPALPAVVRHVNEALANPRTSARDLANLLASDPAIAARLLGMANSAAYGLGQKVSTLTHAVIVLGFNTVRNFVLASATVRSLGTLVAPRRDAQLRFWRHSIACGALSRILSRRMGNEHPEEAYVLGMLHDVGRIVISGWLEDEAPRIAELVGDGVPLCEAEHEVIATTHAEVGAALLERWCLPPVYVEAVRRHHSPALATEHRTATALVHVADVLVSAVLLTPNEGEHVPPLSREAWAVVNVDTASLPELFGQTFDLLRKAESFLSLETARGA